MNQPVGQFFSAVLGPLKAIKLILSDRWMFIYSLVPLTVYLILYITVYSVQPFSSEVAGWSAAVLAWFPAWLAWLGTFIGWLLWLVYLVTLTLVVYLIGGVVASPVYSLLAERYLALQGYQSPYKSSADKVRLALRMLRVSLLRALIFIPIGLLLFVMSFFPALTPFTGFAAFLIIAFDLTDYSLEVFEYSLRQRFQFFFKRLFSYIGLACFIGVVILVPGLFFLFLPSLVMVGSEVAWNGHTEAGNAQRTVTSQNS